MTPLSTSVLLLTAPMQSWGASSVFTDRGTLPHPTRSGIVGLLGCALGYSRDHDLGWSAHLVIGVRADQPGEVMVDFHTIGGGYPGNTGMVNAKGKPRKTAQGSSATMTQRQYLADAAFLVTVTGPTDQIADIGRALRSPRWPLYLGRKSAIPLHPVLLGVTTATPEHVLDTTPAYRTPERTPIVNADDFTALEALLAGTAIPSGSVQVMGYTESLGAQPADAILNDNPLSFNPRSRTYGPRPIGYRTHIVPAAGTGVTAWLTQHAHIETLTGVTA